MGKPLKRRLKALEARQRQPQGSYVLTFDPEAGETAADALRRAPGPGGYLVVARILTPNEWCRAASRQQARLAAGVLH